jgi:light-regulated signal transduction histidine kinase (bacteriophytochrome)
MIGSYTQLLAERYRGQLDSDADEFIHYVVDGVHRMQILIDGLLAYSRVERRGGRLRETNCAEVLATVRMDLQQSIAESGAVITGASLPVVIADPRQMGQLLQNLVSNAIKFRKPGAAPEITVSAMRQETEWLFAVKDDGIGIPKDQRGRLFQIFQRLHNRSQYPGTGIGLAICKKIVDRHGGRIWLESEPGHGTTFLFTLPLKPRESERV